VCAAEEHTPGLRELVRVKWDKVEDSNLNLYKFPRALKLSISLGLPKFFGSFFLHEF